MSSAPRVKQSQDAIAPASRSGSYKITPLEPTNDIRKYFRPRYNPIPAQECADSAEEDSKSDGREDGVNSRIGGFFRSKYTPVKQDSDSGSEDTDEEEDSDGPIPYNSSKPPPPQVSETQATGQPTTLKNGHQQPLTIKKEEDDSPEPDPIDLIPRSTIPSPPAPHTHPTRAPMNHTATAMAIDSPEVSASSSEQEYLSAEEPEIEPSVNIRDIRDINIHTGAELDADTEEDSDEEDGDGEESENEALVVGRGLGR